MFKRFFALVAQLAERRILNSNVRVQVPARAPFRIRTAEKHELGLTCAGCGRICNAFELICLGLDTGGRAHNCYCCEGDCPGPEWPPRHGEPPEFTVKKNTFIEPEGYRDRK